MRPLDRGAVARVVEQAARLAGNTDKLTTSVRVFIDLLRESDQFAADAGKNTVGEAEVQEAIDAQIHRGEVVDIEREVELGGPLHSKGVLMLSGFLGGRFGGNRPFSALAEVPIKQSFAVTGSVDQRGQIQAIGGFIDSCRLTGFTGRQGVIIPASNVKHLMLRRDVVATAREGRFAIYPINTVDEGLELLTGISVGEPDGGGKYPPDTSNDRISARLDAFARKAVELARASSGMGAQP